MSRSVPRKTERMSNERKTPGGAGVREMETDRDLGEEEEGRQRKRDGAETG